MNLKQLETFLEIVRCGSFSAAAERLNATPSTVSTRILELEADLNVLLFDRSLKRTRLTAKGRELENYAVRVIAACTEIKMRIGDGQALSGHLRLGVAELVAVTWLPALVEAIHRTYPRLTLELVVALTLDIQQLIATGDVDLALLPGTTFEAHLTARSLGRVSFSWMAGRSVRLPDRTIEPSDFRSLRVLSLGRNSFHHRTVERWLGGRGEESRAVDLCNSMGAIASLTEAGVGVSLLPARCYQAEIARGTLRVLRTDPEGPTVEFFAVCAASGASSLPILLGDLAVDSSTFDF